MLLCYAKVIRFIHTWYCMKTCTQRREIANLILAMQMLQNGCRKNKINFPKVQIKI